MPISINTNPETELIIGDRFPQLNGSKGQSDETKAFDSSIFSGVNAFSATRREEEIVEDNQPVEEQR